MRAEKWSRGLFDWFVDCHRHWYWYWDYSSCSNSCRGSEGRCLVYVQRETVKMRTYHVLIDFDLARCDLLMVGLEREGQRVIVFGVDWNEVGWNAIRTGAGSTCQKSHFGSGYVRRGGNTEEQREELRKEYEKIKRKRQYKEGDKMSNHSYR